MQRQLALLIATLVFSVTSPPSWSAAAAPAAVWRCEAVNGGAVAYQAERCLASERNTARQLSPDALPSPAAAKASTSVARREAKLARAMARQRVKREQAVSFTHASLSGPVRQVSVGQARSAREQVRQARRRSDVFRAEVPGGGRPARRQAEATAAPSP